MSYLLNIETATKNCSVSIALNGKTILCKEMAELGYSHAEKLHVFIEEVLDQTNIKFSDLNAIAVSQGPGSYTGLRIGISAAKGLCFALDIPLIAVDTLKILATQLTIKEGLIVPMIDARRMEVFSAVYNSAYEIVSGIQAEIITEDSYSNYNQNLYFIGDCNEKCKTVLNRDNFIFLDQFIYPSAQEMSQWSFDQFQKGDFVDVGYFEPYYLKDFMTTSSKKIIV